MTASAVGPPRARVTRVLLADDSDGLRLLVRSWLSTVDDLEVVAEASNGAEAVALTDAHRPDVVVLDVAMPVMDGLEALTELHRRFPSLPVVMLSGFAERDVADQATRRGAFAFVEKSGDLDPLVEAVRRAASGPALPTPRRDETSTPPPAAPPPSAPSRRATPPLPHSWATSWVPTIAALVVFGTVTAWRLAESDPRAPVTFLYAVPILLVAVRHGLQWGLLTAALALAAYVAWAQSLDDGPSVVDNAVRAVVFVSVAVVAGAGFDRLRRAGRQQRQVSSAVVSSNQRLAELNEELQRVNRDLASTNADLRQFGYVVGHDLAEPLRTLRSFAGLLQSRSADRLDDDGRQYLHYLLAGADRLDALVRDLRDYTRTGAADLVPLPVPLDEVLDDVRAALRATLEERGATVRSGALPVVAGDRSMLGLVLQNLVSNAVKFNRSPSPVIEVDAEPQGEQWRIAVRDNGIGVDPAMTQRAFDLFGRLHGRDEFAGTGLGLAIARRIVERHGGSIALAPRDGGGTVVTVVLPGAPPYAGDLALGRR